MKTYKSKDRVITIPIGNSSQGRATAQTLHKKRATLALQGLNSAALSTQATGSDRPDSVTGRPVDGRSLRSLKSALQERALHFGGIDVVTKVSAS